MSHPPAALPMLTEGGLLDGTLVHIRAVEKPLIPIHART